jgi:hypothetical protein
MSNLTAQDLLEHIKADERGYEVYILEDVPQFTQAAFDELVATAQLAHMGQGYYFITRWIKLIQKNAVADTWKTAQAIARKHGYKLLMTPAVAANSLRLELGVQARIQYESSGPDEIQHVGPWKIQFVHMPAEVAWWSSRPGGRIIQALRWTREGNAAKTLNVLQGLLPNYVKQDLLDNIDKVPEPWMQELVRKLELQEEPA